MYVQTTDISPQCISISVNIDGGPLLKINFVYAKCLCGERLEIWNELHMAVIVIPPWSVGGDFNTIRHDDEKREESSSGYE